MSHAAVVPPASRHATSLVQSPLKLWVVSRRSAQAVKTHAAPTPCELSSGPPTIAVLPSPDSETDSPCLAAPTAPVPTTFCPYWVQTPLLRTKAHAAPALLLSNGPP